MNCRQKVDSQLLLSIRDSIEMWRASIALLV